MVRHRKSSMAHGIAFYRKNLKDEGEEKIATFPAEICSELVRIGGSEVYFISGDDPETSNSAHAQD